MPDLNPAASLISPSLPVSPAAPVPGNSTQSANASQNNDGQPAFAQVLRDKQQANADAAKSAKTDKPSKTSGDSKTDKSTAADAASENESTEEVVTRTPAELAQLLAAAGLIANTATPQTAVDASDKDTSALVADDAKIDLAANATKLATASALTLGTQTDKTAAISSNPAASLAANTANTASSTAAEQALAAQSQLTSLDTKSGQSGASSQNQQGADKQAQLSLANDADKLKARTEAAGSNEPNFAGALEAATKPADGTLNHIPSTTTSATQSTAPASIHTVNTPVGRQGWADEVGQRVLWTAKSDNSRAELVLTPAQLGRIEVSIQMNGDQATASFVAANSIAREAMQDAMPRLRELMAQAGIQLGQADVSAGQSGQSNAQNERRSSRGSAAQGMLGVDGLLSTSSPGAWTKQGTGMVDTFA